MQLNVMPFTSLGVGAASDVQGIHIFIVIDSFL